MHTVHPPGRARLLRLSTALLGLALVLALVAANHLAFTTWLGTGYPRWFLFNADKLAFAFALATLVWDRELDSHTGLISAHPLTFLGSYWQLMGLTVFALGTFVRAPRKAGRSSALDTLLGTPLLTAATVAVVAWLVIVAPLQYFVHLVAGAPARIFLASDRQVVASWDSYRLEMEEVATGAPLADGWWTVSLSTRPVKVTAAFAAGLLLVLKQVV